MNDNILGQGVKFNPRGVGVAYKSTQQGVGEVQNPLNTLAKVGNKIVIDLATRENKEKKQELAEAERNLSKIEHENDRVSSIQTEAKIKSMFEEYERNNIGKGYLDGERLNQLEVINKGIISTVSNAKGLSVESKERLKAMGVGFYDKYKSDYFANNYKENRQVQETSLLDTYADAKQAGAIAIQEGRMEDALHWGNITRNTAKALRKHDGKKYDREWEIKQNYNLDFEYGLGVANAGFGAIREEFFKTAMTEDDLNVANKKYDDLYVQLSTPEAFKAITGSEDGLAHQEFLKGLSTLKNSNIENMKKMSKARHEKEKELKNVEAYKWKKDPNNAYKVNRNLDVVPREAYSRGGDFLASQFNVVYGDFLSSKDEYVTNNADVYEVMKKYPEKFSNELINLIPNQMADAITIELDKGNYEGVKEMLSADFGDILDEDFRNLLDNALVNATNGRTDLTKLGYLTGGTDEQSEKIRQTYSDLENFKKSQENIAQFKNIDNRVFANTFKGAKLEIMDSLLVMSNKSGVLANKSNAIISEMNTGRFKIFAENMTESQREKFYKAKNSLEQEKMLKDYFNNNPKARMLADEYDEQILTANLGDYRPININGFGEFVNKDYYSQDYVQEFIDQLPNKKVYYTDDNGVEKYLGKNDSKKLTKIVSDSDDNLSVYFGDKKLYTIEDGLTKYITIPRQPDGWQKQSFWDIFGGR